MPISISDLGELVGYDPESHTMKGLPSLKPPATGSANGAPIKELQPPVPPTGIPSMMGSVVPNASPMDGIPSLQKPSQSTLSKIGHGLGKVGEYAGDALMPGVFSQIPGTPLNKQFEQNREQKLAGEQAGTGFKQAETAKDWASLNPKESGLATNPIELFQKDPEKFQQFQELTAKQEKTGDPVKDIKQDEEGNEIAVLESGKTLPLGFKGEQKPVADSAAADTTRAETIRQQQLEGKPVSPDDAAWLKSHNTEKTLGPAATAALRPEQGSYLPVPDPSDPIHKIIGWVDPKSGHFRSLQDIPGMAGNNEIKPTGQSASREDQAATITRASDGLIADIQKNRDKVGNVGAIIQSAFLGTPLADPAQAELATEIASYAALQPAMHGFRGSDALKAFEKMIGGIPNNPDALIASINGIKKTAGYFNPNQQGESSGAPRIQKNSKGDFRYSTDGGKTWQTGKPPQ